MPFDPDAFLELEPAQATTFADPGDIARFRRAKAQGMSDTQAFKYGDNGIGAWGDDTTGDEPIVAIPKDHAVARFGSLEAANGQQVEIHGPNGPITARIGDLMPHSRNIKNGANLDLNPGAYKALGLPVNSNAPVQIRFLGPKQQASAPAQSAFDPDAFLSGDVRKAVRPDPTDLDRRAEWVPPGPVARPDAPAPYGAQENAPAPTAQPEWDGTPNVTQWGVDEMGNPVASNLPDAGEFVQRGARALDRSLLGIEAGAPGLIGNVLQGLAQPGNNQTAAQNRTEGDALVRALQDANEEAARAPGSLGDQRQAQFAQMALDRFKENPNSLGNEGLLANFVGGSGDVGREWSRQVDARGRDLLSQYKVDPSRDTDPLIRGAEQLAGALPIAASGGILGAGAVAGTQAYGETYSAAKAEGKSDEEANREGVKAAADSVKALPVYAATGGLSGALEHAVVPEAASALTKALAHGAGNLPANVAASALLRRIEGGDASDIGSSIAPDLGFALLGAGRTFSHANKFPTPLANDPRLSALKEALIPAREQAPSTPPESSPAGNGQRQEAVGQSQVGPGEPAPRQTERAGEAAPAEVPLAARLESWRNDESPVVVLNKGESAGKVETTNAVADLGDGRRVMYRPQEMSAAQAVKAAGGNAEPTPVAEHPDTLKAQQEQLIAGRRPAMMFTPGEAELPVPDGMARVTTPNGTYHYDPELVSASKVRKLDAAGRQNEILGLGSESKADVAASGEKPVAVTERTPEGTEVRAAAASPGKAGETAQHFEKTKTPGNVIDTETPEGVINQRKANENQKRDLSRQSPLAEGAIERPGEVLAGPRPSGEGRGRDEVRPRSALVEALSGRSGRDTPSRRISDEAGLGGKLIRPEDLPPLPKGNGEHSVALDPATDRYWKATRNRDGAFGMIRTHNDGRNYGRNATASEYLNRIKLQNEVFGDDIRIHGVTDERNPRILTSQPNYGGTELHPAEYPKFIDWMKAKGFDFLRKGQFYRPEDGVFVSDAVSSNVRKLGEGKYMPFDVMMDKPTGAHREHLLERATEHDQNVAAAKEAAGAGGTTELARELAAEAGSLRERLGMDRSNPESGHITIPSVEEIADFGRKIYKAGQDFASWAKEMVAHVGEKVRAYLVDAWQRIKSDEGGAIGGSGKRGGADREAEGQRIREAVEASHKNPDRPDGRELKGPTVPKPGDTETRQRVAEPLAEALRPTPVDRATGYLGGKLRDLGNKIAPALTAHIENAPARAKAAVIHDREIETKVNLKVEQGYKAVKLADQSVDARDERAIHLIKDTGMSRDEIGRQRQALQEAAADPATHKKIVKNIDSYLPDYQHAFDSFDRLRQSESIPTHDEVVKKQLREEQNYGTAPEELPDYASRLSKGNVMGKRPGDAPVLFSGDGAGGGYHMKHRQYPDIASMIIGGEQPVLGLAKAAAARIGSGQKILSQLKAIDAFKQEKVPWDNKPVIADQYEEQVAHDGRVTRVIPEGYVKTRIGDNEVLVHKQFAGVMKALFGEKWLGTGPVGNAFMKYAAFAKHATLVLDTFHAMRIMYKQWSYGGGNPVHWDRLINGDWREPLNYRQGLSLIEYRPEDLAKAVQAGEITEREAGYARQMRPMFNELIEGGLNMGRNSENLWKELEKSWVDKASFGQLGKFNHWLFEKLQRGVTAQVAVEAYRKNLKMYGGEMSRADIARKTAFETNRVFSNLGTQGIFKSKTGQALARIIFLAPQWAEGQFRTNVAQSGQVLKMPLDALQGRFRAGVLARGMGKGILTMLAVNQVLNYALNGKSTFENDDPEHKLDAHIPVPGTRGFHFNPTEIADETFHGIMRQFAYKRNVMDAALGVIQNKFSGLTRGAITMGTGKDFAGRPFVTDDTPGGKKRMDLGARAKAALVDTLPSPMPLQSLLEKSPNSAVGYRLNREPGSVTKQVAQSFGMKLEKEQSPEQRLYAEAAPYRDDNVTAFPKSQFSDLKRALDRGIISGDKSEAKQTLTDLLANGVKKEAIDKALGVSKSGEIKEPVYAKSSDDNQAFLNSLNQYQKGLAQKAIQENKQKVKLYQTLIRAAGSR